MNPDLQNLQTYPFARLRQLKAHCQPPTELTPISLAIGEPQHAPPPAIIEALQKNLAAQVSKYPPIQGTDALRSSIARWLTQRYQLPADSIDPVTQVLPVNGVREALGSMALTVVNRQAQLAPLILMPNPFYQVYEGAAWLAGAEPCYVSGTAETNWQPDFNQVTAAQWQRCQLLFLCSPNNPTGQVLDIATMQHLIQLADEYDFVIGSDECYSEIYADETQPLPGLLQACALMGRHDYRRCVVFNSLSKRSNAPGLRSGLVAGDATLLQAYLRYRTYNGCAMPLHIQTASAVAWQDETHVLHNRELYRQKFATVLDILKPVSEVKRPDGGFFLWMATPTDSETFTRELFAQQHVTVLPGQYLAREVDGVNPGHQHVRMALVATEAECVEAAWRVRKLLEQ